MKDVGMSKDGSPTWEYDVENVSYLGLAEYHTIYDVWLTDQGYVPVIGPDNETLPLTVDAGGPYSGRVNQGITLDDAVASGGVPPYSWHWTVEMTNLVSIDPSDGNDRVVTVVYSDNGSYYATVTVTDSVGATASDTTTISVTDYNPPPPPPKPPAGPTQIGGAAIAAPLIFAAQQSESTPVQTLNCDPSPPATSCFYAGTKIAMADGTYKNIEDVIVGDVVKAFDAINERVVDGVVTKVFHHHPSEMSADYYLVINNLLKVTPDHILWVNSRWVPADDIKIGDKLKGLDGNDIIVNSIGKVFKRAPMFNLEIAVYHNYFAEDVLVHNAKANAPDTCQYATCVGGNCQDTSGCNCAPTDQATPTADACTCAAGGNCPITPTTPPIVTCSATCNTNCGQETCNGPCAQQGKRRLICPGETPTPSSKAAPPIIRLPPNHREISYNSGSSPLFSFMLDSSLRRKGIDREVSIEINFVGKNSKGEEIDSNIHCEKDLLECCDETLEKRSSVGMCCKNIVLNAAGGESPLKIISGKDLDSAQF
ncbi:MAG TPA: hypothetical protein ENG24_02935, partial [Thermoplasmatales archaeon]|nr:hypothetical protein [Thermoplasmatales archaeon]